MYATYSTYTIHRSYIKLHILYIYILNTTIYTYTYIHILYAILISIENLVNGQLGLFIAVPVRFRAQLNLTT